MKRQYDVVVIGGGPAGLAAACSARENGAQRVLVLERDTEVGGILNQCIHNGFGLHYFKEELTGPEYAWRFTQRAEQAGVEILTDTMVLSVSADRQIRAINPREGYLAIDAKAIVLAMGCRERTRGAISTPGDRPAGVFTAGTAQRYINVEGWMVGRRVVILGSGDIGLIMARRMTLEGAKVLACVELMPYSNGLNRNVVQCLQDYHIPLYLSHTITRIIGKSRVEQVEIAQVGPDRRPVPGTQKVFDCDTVLLSVGLIPENELTREAGIPLDRRTNGAVVYENMETEIPGIFACGNVLHVHDLVDFVTAESLRAGASAARFAAGERMQAHSCIALYAGAHVTYTVPQKVRPACVESTAEISFRVDAVMQNRRICVRTDTGRLLCSFPREHLAPGEMEHIILPKKLLDQAAGPLTVSVEEVDKA